MSPEPEVKILVDRDPVKTSFEEWARPGHFSRTIAKGPDTTTWIWNLHADAHEPEAPLVSKRGGRVIHISFDGQRRIES